MSIELHIRTRSQDPLADAVLMPERPPGDTKVVVMDLTGENPDYALLLERIFEADSVAVW
jgi:hypothetical protein